MRRTLIFITTIVALAGCTTAGPFVSAISSDGNGEVVVEKCMVKLNAFLGVVHNSECSNYKVKLIGQQYQPQTERHRNTDRKGNMWTE